MDRVALMLAAVEPRVREDRVCLDCDHLYHGTIRCPACGSASGEPLDTDGPLTSPGGRVSITKPSE